MNEKNQFQQIADFYNRRVVKYGYDPRSCDYGRRESQEKKFRVLSEAFDFSGKSILDVGCGLADYSEYLSTKFSDVKYSGVDLSHEMIAKARTAFPKLDLKVANILEEPETESHDIVSANGIFYLLGLKAPNLMKELIRVMFLRCRECLAFNSLSTWATVKEGDEYYADPLLVVDWCRQFTPWVTLRHDYLVHDFTVYLYKNNPPQ